MIFKKAHRRASLRFTKWSRKSYAAFKSVGRHVTIGNLKNIVADVLLGKQKNVLSICKVIWKNKNKSCEEEWFDPPEEELQNPFLLLSVLQTEKTNRRNIKVDPVELFYASLKAVCHKRFQLFYFPLEG